MARTDTTFDFDYSEFDDLIKQFESLGGDAEDIGKDIINSAVDVGATVYAQNVPLGDKDNLQGHAKDNIKKTTIKKGKNGWTYKLISFKGDRSYLYMIENGSSRYLPKPWIDKAKFAVRNATAPIMRDTLIKEIKKHLGE